jgi:hypothetical protein
MHPEFVRQIAADHIADLTGQAVQSPRNPLHRLAG